MVQCECAVVQRPVCRRRIRGIVQAGSHAAGHVEAAGDADRANRIQPVGILHDAGFQRLRRDAGGETVRLDCMRGSFDTIRRPAEPGEDLAGVFGGQPGGLRPQRRVLLHRHAIMQDDCRGQHGSVAPGFLVRDGTGAAPYPQQVRAVMRAVVALGSHSGQQVRRKVCLVAENSVDCLHGFLWLRRCGPSRAGMLNRLRPAGGQR